MSAIVRRIEAIDLFRMVVYHYQAHERADSDMAMAGHGHIASSLILILGQEGFRVELSRNTDRPFKLWMDSGQTMKLIYEIKATENRLSEYYEWEDKTCIQV